MLRTTIQQKHNVDISYPTLIAYLKRKSVGFVPKKSNVFEPNQIMQFLSQADDVRHLANKVK